MALEATHIRFALDIKYKYQVQDLEKYISGSIYPDSRYTTGIDRSLTHFNGILDPDFANDDFHKGWQAHFICDKILNVIMNEKFEKEKFSPEDWRIFASAIKTILDINDINQFDIKKNLKYINYYINPGKENIKTLTDYYRAVADLYKKTNITLKDYYDMWVSIGIDKKSGNKIFIKTKELLKNKQVTKKVSTIYEEMITNYERVI